MPKWIIWGTERKGFNVWPPIGTGIIGLLVQIDNGQWFWFENEFYGFIDDLPEGRQVADALTEVRLGVQVADEEMRRVRAEAASESGLELLKS